MRSHHEVGPWIENHKMVHIDDFILRYRDRDTDQWLVSTGKHWEKPRLMTDYYDDHPTYRMHAIFELKASNDPRLPNIPALHLPDLFHICILEPVPPPVWADHDQPEELDTIYIISIAPPHNVQCGECKSACKKRLQQGLKSLTTEEAQVTEYGTFSTWFVPDQDITIPVTSQARAWGWYHARAKRICPKATEGRSRVPNSVWLQLQKTDMLCTIHKIEYPTGPRYGRRNPDVATIRINPYHTSIMLHNGEDLIREPVANRISLDTDSDE